MSFEHPTELKAKAAAVDHQHLVAELQKPAVNAVALAAEHHVNIPAQPAQHYVPQPVARSVPIGNHANYAHIQPPGTGFRPNAPGHPISTPRIGGHVDQPQPHTIGQGANPQLHPIPPGLGHTGGGNWRSGAALGAGLGLAAGYGLGQDGDGNGQWNNHWRDRQRHEREEREEEREERREREINNIYNLYNEYPQYGGSGYPYGYPYDTANYADIYDQNYPYQNYYGNGNPIASLALGLGMNGIDSLLGLPNSSYNDRYPYNRTYSPTGVADNYSAGVTQDVYPQDAYAGQSGAIPSYTRAPLETVDQSGSDYQTTDNASLAPRPYSSNAIESVPQADRNFNQEQPWSGDRTILGIHVVHEGENLWKIAQHSLSTAGDTTSTPGEILRQVKSIVQVNKTDYPSLVSDPDHIEPGWRLRIPRPVSSSDSY